MVTCSVLNCRSNSDKRLKRNKEESVRRQIRFFSFPKNKEFAEIWEQKCGKAKKINTKYAYICSKHFPRDQYFRNMQHELLNYSPKSCGKLKLDAIPTENLPDIPEVSIESQDIIDTKCTETAQPDYDFIEINTSNFETSIKTEPVDEIICDMDISENIYSVKCEPAEEFICVDKATNTDSSPLEKEIVDLRAENAQLRSKCNLLKGKNIKLEKQNVQLQRNCLSLKEETKYIKKIFTPTQRHKIQNHGKCTQWTTDYIAKCLAIYSNGPQAYRFLLKKQYPLPAVSTLNLWKARSQK